MKTFFIITFLLASFWVSIEASSEEVEKKKNIIFILSDDLGFNDPSIRGNNEILTPNIDALFYQGVALNRYYTHPLCTPTRAALLTGNYAHRIGMQHEVIWNHQPWGLGLDQKLMSQYLKEAGYETHAIGKWHLGHFQEQYAPTRRGFDSFIGNLGPYIHYYNRTFELPPSNFPNMNYTLGYDFRKNLDLDYSEPQKYITDFLNDRAIEIIENSDDDKPFFIYLAHVAMHRSIDADPHPVKQADYEIYNFIQDDIRRRYAAQVKALDDSIGELIEALTRSGKLKDTIIVFTTDNGGPTRIPLVHPNRASNWPLRSMKGLGWEGGIRVDAAVYAPWLPSGVVRNNYFHVIDWLPTLATLANTGIHFDRPIDGIDLSRMIAKGDGPIRDEIETIDEINNTTSLISGEFKLMYSSYAPLRGLADVYMGTNTNANRLNDSYVDIVLNSKVAKNLRKYGKPLSEKKINDLREKLITTCNNQPDTTCNVLQASCLYKILEDPCEKNNLAGNPDFQDKLQELLQKLNVAMTKVAPPRNRGGVQGDFRSNPANNNGIWTWWLPDNVDA